jgi:hypothetical protein
MELLGNNQSHSSPMTVMTVNDPVQKTKIAIGSDRVRPYITEIGLNRGAVNPNARIVPPEIPLLRI